MRPGTGDPHPRLALANPAAGRLIERPFPYGPTRWTELWLACVMALFGACLLAGGDTFALPSYRVIKAFASEDATGAAAAVVAAARLAALWHDGRIRAAPLVRVAGCAGGFLFYTALAVGFALAAPPFPTGLIYGALAAAELHASSRAARDAVLSDSLGVRRRRRNREQPAA
ncbi:hypothetical protein [uncultured Enterovirga sp.]|uniref:hypothetical protein n=1 Tax=uncultured Enterovirga sp. TaxID=2026352 RepID=UPI0035C9F1D5